MTPPSTYDGRHILADLYGCPVLDDVALIDAALRDAALAAGAQLIGIHLHHFGEGQGVTGVALLAESHMSIHTWPEHGYAAIDVFLCGATHDPAKACVVLKDRLGATETHERTVHRGQMKEGKGDGRFI